MPAVPPVTVVMSVFNCEAFVEEAVNSILQQTFSDFRFIIVDDASTDNSKNIIDSIEDDRIQRIYNTSNLGLTRSLKNVISEIRSKYYVLMDADDISMPERIEVLYNFMESHPEYGACGSNYRVIGKDRETNFPTDSEEIRVYFFLGISMMIHPCIFRTEVFRKHQIVYDTNSRYAQDFKMWVDAGKHFKLTNVKEVLYMFREHGLQTSSEKKNLQKAYVQQVCRDELKCLEIDVNEAELGIHDHLVALENIENCGQLLSLNKWLDKLRKANETVHYFDRDVFFRITLERYNYLRDVFFADRFIVKGKYTPRLLYHFLFSKCKPWKYFSFLQNLKFGLKCLFFYSKNTIPA